MVEKTKRYLYSNFSVYNKIKMPSLKMKNAEYMLMEKE
jgi:hypothetical protein